MDGHIALNIQSLRLDVDAERPAVERLGGTIRLALVLLARKLEAAPFRFGENADRFAFDQLEAGALSVNELLGPQGAERLAERLYAALAGER
jgi:hypothetical protein